MKEAIEKLAAFRHLPPGWDSYGGEMIDRAAITAAQQLLLRGLPSGKWIAVPCSNGDVQLELHEGGIDIEIRVSNARQQPGDRNGEA